MNIKSIILILINIVSLVVLVNLIEGYHRVVAIGCDLPACQSNESESLTMVVVSTAINMVALAFTCYVVWRRLKTQ